MDFGVTRYADVGGRRLAYSECSPEHPEGTILLLIGFSARRLSWYRQLPVLGKRFRTLTVDYRDIGDSDPVETDYTLADQADDMAAFLKALHVERAHVVGISMGGFVAQELALRHPDRVDHLILVATSAGGAGHVPAREELLKALFIRETLEVGELARKNYGLFTLPGHFERHPEDWDIVAEIARDKPLKRDPYFRQLRSTAHHDTAERLKQLRHPTLIIHGLEDPLVPFVNAERLAALIPNAQLYSIPACGHIPSMEHPELFNRVVADFASNAWEPALHLSAPLHVSYASGSAL